MNSEDLIDRSENILIDFMEVMVSRDLLISQILDSNIYTHENIKKVELHGDFKLEDVIRRWNTRKVKTNLLRYLEDPTVYDPNLEDEILDFVDMGNSIIPTNISSLFGLMVAKSFVNKAYVRIDSDNKKQIDWLLSVIETSDHKDIISIIDESTPIEDVLSEKGITTYIARDIDYIKDIDLDKITKSVKLTALIANYGYNLIDLGEGLLALKYEPLELPKSENFEIVSLGTINIWDFEDEELIEGEG